MCPKLGHIFHHQEVSTIAQKKKRASKSGYKTRPPKQSRSHQRVKSTAYHAKSAFHSRQAQSQKENEASNEYAVSQTQSAVEGLAHDGLQASGNAAKKLLQQEKVKSQTATAQRTQQSQQEFSASDPSFSTNGEETHQPPAPSAQERGAEAFKPKVQSDLVAQKQEQPPVQEPLPQPTAPIYQNHGSDIYQGYHGAAPRTRPEREAADLHSPKPPVPSYQERGADAFKKKIQSDLAAKKQEQPPVPEPLPQPPASIYQDHGSDIYQGYHGAAPRTRPERETASHHSPKPSSPSYQERGADAFKKKVQSDLAAKKQEQPLVQEPPPQPTSPIYRDRGSDFSRGDHRTAPRTRPERETAPHHSPKPSVPSYQERGAQAFQQKRKEELRKKAEHPIQNTPSYHNGIDSVPYGHSPRTADPGNAAPVPSAQEQGRRSFIKKRGEELTRKAAHEPDAAAIPELPSEDGNSVSYRGTSIKGSEKLQSSANAAPSTPTLRKKDRSAPKKRPPFSIKTKASMKLRTKQNARPVSPAKAVPAADPKELGKKRFKKAAQKKMAQQARRGATAAVKLSQRLVTAAAKTVKAGVEMLVGLVGTSGLFVILCVVLLVGAVIASPFGIFFSNEPAEGAIPLSAAVAKINMEYYNRLNDLQTEEEYEEITLEGQPPDWVDVISVFACHVAGAQDGMDVAILDEERVDLLRETFWDMCTLEVTVEEPEETIPTEPTLPITGPTEPTEPPKPSLTIRIIAKTADEMRVEYSFSHLQNDALDMLLAESDAIDELIGSLDISQDDALGLISGLPEDTTDQRKEVVRHALILVGKVNYFWGGKSLVIGWDSRWGQPTRVTAPGSPSTGTTRPYGLDCSGFVDWVFYNASGGSYVLGHGGGAATQHIYCTSISWSQAQPGDLVFYPNDSHVGIVGGRDENGNLLIIHCASGLNNVVITGQSGFASIGRPMYFG